MECSAFFEQVAKHFRFLFDEYGFAVVYQRTEWGFSNCTMLLQSQYCCIRAARDRGDALLEVGPLSAPGTSLIGPSPWFGLQTVIDYLTGSEVPSVMRVTADLPFDDSRTDWELAQMACAMHPYCDQIFELFREESFRKRQAELEEFRWRGMESLLKKMKNSAHM